MLHKWALPENFEKNTSRFLKSNTVQKLPFLMYAYLLTTFSYKVGLNDVIMVKSGVFLFSAHYCWECTNIVKLVPPLPSPPTNSIKF